MDLIDVRPVVRVRRKRRESIHGQRHPSCRGGYRSVSGFFLNHLELSRGGTLALLTQPAMAQTGADCHYFYTSTCGKVRATTAPIVSPLTVDFISGKEAGVDGCERVWGVDGCGVWTCIHIDKRVVVLKAVGSIRASHSQRMT
jgi:hypothetical protein